MLKVYMKQNTNFYFKNAKVRARNILMILQRLLNAQVILMILTKIVKPIMLIVFDYMIAAMSIKENFNQLTLHTI